jgi:hypothetical protein
MFYKHSLEPKGSPFLSFTPSIEVAHRFGSEKTMAFLVDPRVLFANYTSFFSEEIEFLTPLVTFPDEFMAMTNAEVQGAMNASEKKVFFETQIRKILTSEYGEVSGEKYFNEMIELNKKYNKAGSIIQIEKGANKASLVDTHFPTIKKIFDTFKKPAVVDMVDKHADEEINCIYALKAFWK